MCQCANVPMCQCANVLMLRVDNRLLTVPTDPWSMVYSEIRNIQSFVVRYSIFKWFWMNHILSLWFFIYFFFSVALL